MSILNARVAMWRDRAGRGIGVLAHDVTTTLPAKQVHRLILTLLWCLERTKKACFTTWFSKNYCNGTDEMSACVFMALMAAIATMILYATSQSSFCPSQSVECMLCHHSAVSCIALGIRILDCWIYERTKSVPLHTWERCAVERHLASLAHLA